MEIGKELMHALSPRDIIDVEIFGYPFNITDTVITMWIAMAVIIALACIFTRKLVTVPEGKQNGIEIVVEGINKFTKNTIGHHWKHFAPFIGTLIIFLIVSNIISIFSFVPSSEQLYELTHWGIFERLPEYSIRPPTKDINVPFALATVTTIFVIYGGIKIKRLSGWLKSFIEPSVIMLPMKVMEYFIRVLSLSFRLFGNILGAFIVMELIYFAFPVILPAALSIYFDLFDGALQAYIFVFLTTFYIAEAVE